MQNLDGINQPYTCEQWAAFGGIESYNLVDDGSSVDDGEAYPLFNLFSINGNWHNIAIFDQNMVFRFFTNSPPQYIIDNMVELLLLEGLWTLGDVNYDSIIDVLDLIIVVNNIINQENYNYILDMNEDDTINIQDITILIGIIIEG